MLWFLLLWYFQSTYSLNDFKLWRKETLIDEAPFLEDFTSNFRSFSVNLFKYVCVCRFSCIHTVCEFIMSWIIMFFSDVSRDTSGLMMGEVALEISPKTLWFKTWKLRNSINVFAAHICFENIIKQWMKIVFASHFWSADWRFQI